MTGFLMSRETSGHKETDKEEKVTVGSSLQPSEGAWPADILILAF